MNITKKEALAALDAMLKSGAYAGETMNENINYVKDFGIVPEWMKNQKPNKWFVRHAGQTYETTATGERDAINNIRWNLYRETPESALPPFEAICPAKIISDAVQTVRAVEGRADIESRTTTDLFGRHTISKQDAILRLKKMMRKAS